MATLPATPKGTAKVTPGRGVKVNHIYYWSGSFQSPAAENQQVPIRYDPFDAGTPMHSSSGAWRPFIAEDHRNFRHAELARGLET